MEERERRIMELERLKHAIYEDNPVGCCMHVFFDDFNYDRATAEFCLRYAQERGHLICEAAAKAALLLTDAQLKWMHDNPELTFDLAAFMPKELL